MEPTLIKRGNTTVEVRASCPHADSSVRVFGPQPGWPPGVNGGEVTLAYWVPSLGAWREAQAQGLRDDESLLAIFDREPERGEMRCEDRRPKGGE